MQTSIAGSRPHRWARPETGVTLLELLVVLTILSLMVSLVAPRVGRSVESWKLRSAAERVAQTLSYARTRALYEQRYYLVEIRSEGNLVRLLGPASGLVREYALPSDIRWEEEGNPASPSMRLVFSPSGAVEERTLWLRNRQGDKVKIHLSFLLGSPGIEITRQGS